MTRRLLDAAVLSVLVANAHHFTVAAARYWLSRRTLTKGAQ